ncbi:Molybdate metabolism regulator [Labilithrix luteola]|uniref:Molybdate metabolism regulator n=1 Tax=Labilithrix luteola TaxID=1391654 RepID=A0A0K1QG66_9BACT|nr:DUF4132 domain-containing protein [Labilithrix luteola]AKV04754.1 Molybdate metabolism regulator [Labilithrix luteola]
MARYEFSEGSSNKFWEIVLSDTCFTTTFGRIGSSGQTSSKSFPTAAKAKLEHDKLVAEKVKKGYLLVGSACAPAVAPPSPAPAPPPPPPTPIAPVFEPPALVPAAAPHASGVILDWTPACAAAAEKQRKALAITPQPKGDAAALFAEVRQAFARNPKWSIDHGLVRASVYKEELTSIRRMLVTDAMPAKLEPNVAAGAYLLLQVSTNYHRRPGDSFRLPLETTMAFWAAHSGLPFALEAFLGTLGPMVTDSAHHADGVYAMWLTNTRKAALGTMFLHRPDRFLRALWLAASPEEQAAAREKAVALRAAGDLTQRSVLSSIFLDPDWIDADLRERVATGEQAYVNDMSLLNAGSLEALTAYFSTLGFEEAVLLAPYDGVRYLPRVTWTLLDRFREGGVPALAHWLARLFKDRTSSERWFILDGAHHLFDVLASVTNSPDVVEAAASILTNLGDEAIAKKSDPRPLAIETLLRSPGVALPVVQQAAKDRHTWAKNLLPQLERLTNTRAAGPTEEASPGELPEVLRTSATFKTPAFWKPEAFTVPQTHSGKAFPRSAIETLGALLAKGDADAIAHVKESGNPASLAAFAWDLFQSWLTHGAPAKEKWGFFALGLLGDDESARKLTPLIRAWPGESAHQRAVLGLDVLATIGSDVALMMLNGIVQKVKFKGLQERARDKMDEIAEKRGLTAEELADRLVPDLDLEDDGSKTLDFGPRSFRVGFDETLSPFVMDASGTRLKDLPKPNSKDDAALAGASVEAWKAMKKDARTLSALEILRLELAMSNERRWAAKDFEAFLVRHPLLVHLVRRLVWGTFDTDGKLTGTFRVAEDQTFADREDETFGLAADAIVGLPHRLVLSEADVSAWAKVLGDYDLAQPFQQLGRDVYVVGDADKKGAEFQRFVGREVETKKVIGLQSRGWRRGSAHDNGTVPYFYKPITRDLNAGIQIENGIYVGSMDYTDPTQTLGIVDFGPGEPDWGRVRSNAVPIATIPAVVLSEVIRDLESLGAAPTDAK